MGFFLLVQGVGMGGGGGVSTTLLDFGRGASRGVTRGMKR
jgi:hypothetical protein